MGPRTVGIADVVDFLQRQSLGTTLKGDLVGNGLDCGKAWRRGCWVTVLSNGEDSGLGVLEFDFEHTVLLLVDC